MVKCFCIDFYSDSPCDALLDGKMCADTLAVEVIRIPPKSLPADENFSRLVSVHYQKTRDSRVVNLSN